MAFVRGMDTRNAHNGGTTRLWAYHSGSLIRTEKNTRVYFYVYHVLHRLSSDECKLGICAPTKIELVSISNQIAFEHQSIGYLISRYIPSLYTTSSTFFAFIILLLCLCFLSSRMTAYTILSLKANPSAPVQSCARPLPP